MKPRLSLATFLLSALAAATGLAQPQPPPGVTLIPDLAYREGNEAWKLDLALPTEPSDTLRPALVFVHGGGWRSGDKRRGYFLQGAFDYAQRGYVAISVNYRLTDDAPFPACIEDVKTAVRWLRAHAEEYGVDPERIGAYGNSAGAHLVSLLALTSPADGLEGDGPWSEFSSAIQAVCASAAPTDFAHWGKPGQRNRFEAELFRGPADTFDERLRQGSPINHVSASAPPMLLIHGEADRVVPFTQGTSLAQALIGAGAPDVRFRSFAGEGHGVFVQRGEDTKPAMAAFFAEVL